MSHQTPEQRCPQCHHRLNRATSPYDDNAAPCEGAFSVCIRCGAVMTFQSDLTLRLTTDAEIDALPVEALMEIAKVKAAVIAMQSHRRVAVN